MVRYLANAVKKLMKSIRDKRELNKEIKKRRVIIKNRLNDEKNWTELLSEGENLTLDDRKYFSLRLWMNQGARIANEDILAELLETKRERSFFVVRFLKNSAKRLITSIHYYRIVNKRTRQMNKHIKECNILIARYTGEIEEMEKMLREDATLKPDHRHSISLTIGALSHNREKNQTYLSYYLKTKQGIRTDVKR